MKKVITLALALAMVFSMAVVASAKNTTTLTTTVPGASYTLNIPADHEIPFDARETDIGTVTITNGSGFAYGKNVAVTVIYDAFKSDNVSTTIPISLQKRTSEESTAEPLPLASGDVMIFQGKTDGTVANKALASFRYTSNLYGPLTQPFTIDKLVVEVASDDWGKALAGEYSTTITFTAEVVVDN